MRFLFLLLLAVASGCGTMNLSETIAGGECGSVDYSITVMGTKVIGIEAERECIEKKEDESSP